MADTPAVQTGRGGRTRSARHRDRRELHSSISAADGLSLSHTHTRARARARAHTHALSYALSLSVFAQLSDAEPFVGDAPSPRDNGPLSPRHEGGSGPALPQTQSRLGRSGSMHGRQRSGGWTALSGPRLPFVVRERERGAHVFDGAAYRRVANAWAPAAGIDARWNDRRQGIIIVIISI